MALPPNIPDNLKQQPFTILAGPDVLEGEGEINLESAYRLKEITDRLGNKFNIDYFFKSSYDKANRTSIDAFRGPGVALGSEMLQDIKEKAGVKITTDIHTAAEIPVISPVADLMQIPAFLSRQTDLLVAAGQSGKPINIKKGQFLSPHDVINAAKKVASTGNNNIFITERGATFGYNNLVVDMRGIPIIQSYGYPVIFDATHSIQLPGGQGTSSGGQREYAITLAKAAVAAGCNGLFFETHPNPDDALCDGPNMIPLDWMEELLTICLEIHALVNKPVPALV